MNILRFIKHFWLRLLRILILCFVISPALPGKSQNYLTEGFEIGAKPDGWTEEFTSGTEPWRYRNGGHSPNDNNWLVPPEQFDITRNPPSAHEGTYNAIFFKQGDNNERTKLITPSLNLLGGTSIELSFYLCQIPWTFEGSTGWDVLRVYYKVSESAPWVLLREYLDPVYEWTQQTLILPNVSSTYYIAFEGHTRWGYGTCIDKISIDEKGSQQLWIKELDFEQPFTGSVPSGSPDVPIMRIDFTVFGNTGNATLDNIHFTSLNTSDNDIELNGVKLYSTPSQKFTTDNPLGTATNFVSGITSFTGLNLNLPQGQSYVWLAYDLKMDVIQGNILDVKVAAGSILANDSIYPQIEDSPGGYRTIYKTQYFEDFEGVHNWNLTGEFEVNTPAGLGGSPGNPDPPSAFSGTRVLGTDLTGLGSNPYNYESDLSGASNYTATSPALNLLYYKSLNLFFQRYLNIEVWDHSSIQVSSDDGTTWHSIWESTSYLSDFQWTGQQIPVPDAYAKTNQLKIRYQMGSTDGQNNYSGWNIDDIYLTGEFISKDAGVSEWIYPLSGSGHSANDSIIVRVNNYGGAEITDDVPVSYSLDGGTTWKTDIMTQNIPVGGSIIFTFPTKADLSSPGLKSVMAKTVLPGDQGTNDDQVSTQIYIVPTYKPPYLENFESNQGYFRNTGNNFWEYGTPAGSVINRASSGLKSWVTGLTKKYGDIISQKNMLIFEDDFEFDLGWSYSGEFERNIPDNMHLPYFANSGYYCIGTDLSGKGTLLFNYENGISEASSYKAISPAFDVSDYNNLMVSFMSWITIRTGDSVKFEVSEDDGTNWITLWKNTEGAILEEEFTYMEFILHDSLSQTSLLRFRFSLFYSSAAGPVAQGWSIDDFLLTGDLINTDEGNLSSPSYDLTGLTNPLFETRIWIDTEQDVDGATLLYSLDEGTSWTPVANTSGYDTYWNWYTGKPVSALGLNGWSGQSGDWITARHLLPPDLVGQDNVQFRFKFKADKFNNEFDGIALDDIRIIEAPGDVGVLDVLSPVSGCDLSSTQKFTLRLRNYGIRNLHSGDSIRIGYNIERAGIIQQAEETLYLTGAFPSGTSQDFSLTGEFDLSFGGDYHTNIFTIEEDPFFYQGTSNDTLYKLIKVNNPVIDLGPDVNTMRPDTVILRAFSGVAGQTYLWQDSSTDSVYHVSTEGTFYVRVSNTIGCSASDTVHVAKLITDVGVIELVGPASACQQGTQVPVIIKIQNFGTDTLQINDTVFIYRDINSVLLKDTLLLTERLVPDSTLSYTYTSGFDFSSPGLYQMELYTEMGNDLSNNNDTLAHTIEVYGFPVIDLGDDIVVMAPEHELSVTPGYASYLWQDGSTLNTYTVDKAGSGIYRVTVTDIHQCSTVDSVRVTLNVIDIEPVRILSPETACGSAGTIAVSVRLRNTGNQIVLTGETIQLGYKIDGSSTTTGSLVLSNNFLPGDSIDFVFSQTAQVTTGEWHVFSVFTDYSPDMKSLNDTIHKPVGVFETPVVNLGEDYKVVTALEYILDAGPGFASYLWHDGSTTQTYTINTPGINTCRVTVTDVNGCFGSDEIEIMLAVPDISIDDIIHPVTSCSLGTNEKVQVAIRNSGVWDIEQTATISVSYSINGRSSVTENIVLNATFESGSVINHTFTVDENFSVPDQYEIVAATVYASDLVPSNDTMMVNIDVHGSPVVDIGGVQDTILVYDPLILSAAAGYASYRWQDGSTDPDFEITAPGAGRYSVLVTDINGCSTRDSVYAIYDKPDIGITRLVTPVSSCKLDQDESLSIEIVNNGYYRISDDDQITVTYSVNSENPVSEVFLLTGALHPGQSGVLSFTAGYDFSETGNYQLVISLDYDLDENLLNNSLNSEVNVWGFPEVEIGGGKDTMKVGLPVTLDAGTGNAAYIWHDNSGSNIFRVVKYGLCWVLVTNEHGCSERDSVYISSPYQVDEHNILVFPNPVQDILNVVMELDAEAHVILELFSLQGKIIMREDLKQIQFVNSDINVSGLASGTYYLRIKINEEDYAYPVVVRK